MNPHITLALFHLFLVAPLFFVVGFMRADTPKWVYTLLLILGVIIFIYHGYKFILRWRGESSLVWINALHVAIVAPLLIYIGVKQKETLRGGYELLLMTGFAAFGYHLYSLVKEMQVIDRA
jgi:hypothetical protein